MQLTNVFEDGPVRDPVGVLERDAAKESKLLKPWIYVFVELCQVWYEAVVQMMKLRKSDMTNVRCYAGEYSN